MVFKKKTAAAQAPTEAVRPDYVKVGRCAITYLPNYGNKPIFKGYLYIEEQDGDGDTVSTTYFITAFKAKEGSKAIATGTAKLSEDKECPVSFYLSIMESQDATIYALMNKPKTEQTTEEAPIKLSFFDTEHEYFYQGLVSVPIPF